MKEHKARWRKCEETLAKLLKKGKDTGGFTIEGKGKGEVWKRERKDMTRQTSWSTSFLGVLPLLLFPGFPHSMGTPLPWGTRLADFLLPNS